MSYSINTVEKNSIIRKQFLQKLDDIIFVQDHYTIIQNIIWQPEEIHKNMVYAYFSRFININVLKQCLEFIKQLFDKYIPILYVQYCHINNSYVANLNTNSCHYLIDNYPNSLDYGLIPIIERDSPTIMERLLKNNKLNYNSFSLIMYNIIIENQRMDYFILLPLNQYFIKSLSSNIQFINNIDMLDYVLNNYKIDYSTDILFELLKNFEYSADIINRFMMHGFLDIHSFYIRKYRFKKCNFVNLLYYVLCIKNKEVAFLLSNYVVLNDDLLENIKSCIAAIKLLKYPNIIVYDTFIDQVITHLYNFYDNRISLCDKNMINKEATYIYEKIEKHSVAFI